MIRITALVTALIAALGTLALPAIAGGQSTGRRHACSVQSHYLGSESHYNWSRGKAHDPADESLKTTSYAYGSGSCQPIAFRRWLQLINLVSEHPGNGSFSGPGIRGRWRHIKTVQIPHTCGTGLPSAPLVSTLYGWFSLRVSDLDGRLVGTGTLKLRLAC